MLKHTSLIVAGALVLGMGISTASFAEMPSLDSQSYTWPGSTINTSNTQAIIKPRPMPLTGKKKAAGISIAASTASWRKASSQV